uniref:ATP-dependent RNA helicase n=1 Tax=Oryzias latipes TaxID=8090 RepID=A0A3P9MHP0_ORYLA
MMSPEDEQLSLNLCTDVSSPRPPFSRRKHLTTQQRWASKKRGDKKSFTSSEDETRFSFKQRKQKLPSTEEGAAAPSADFQKKPKAEKKRKFSSVEHKSQDFAPAEEEEEGAVSSEDLQAPPRKVRERSPPKKERKIEGKKKEKDGGKEAGHGSFKTSSLFKHNPDIPDIHSVQKQTIPVLQSGRDALVRSQTGSGKTLSYAVPLVQSLQSIQPKVSRSDGPLALVIVPTRELAVQTFQIFQKLLKPFTWIVPGVLMGGEKRKAEKARIRKGINILVSTPGRLVDHIKHTLSIAFSAVRWLVLDEADRTLDLGFDKDLTVILNSLNSTGPARQNVLLSATLTLGVSRLADVCLKDPVSIQVSGPSSSSDHTGSSHVTSDTEPANASESFAVPEALRQFAVVVPSKIRLVCLAAFVLDKCKDNKVIVFVSSCEAVEFLHSLFTSVLTRPAAYPQLSFQRLHGNMKQEERSEVFQLFSVSQSGVLLCTDVAARGLDLPLVTWIVQYTPPSSAAEYVHRVGRTARIGGRGSSLLFLTPAETAFISELANHNISLSEMKLQEILSCLMLDDTYRGRGKYYSKTSSKALEQEVRERATVLQTEFENFVHSDAQSLQAAKKALQSYLRAYTTYPAHLKHIFHIRFLHLGHAAKSFGLRDAPGGLSSALGSKGPGTKGKNKNVARKQGKSPVPNRVQKQIAGKKRFFSGQREAGMLRSEFSNGLEGGDSSKKRKKRKKEELSGSQEEE